MERITNKVHFSRLKKFCDGVAGPDFGPETPHVDRGKKEKKMAHTRACADLSDRIRGIIPLDQKCTIGGILSPPQVTAKICRVLCIYEVDPAK
jgi:hypothetical protein